MFLLKLREDENIEVSFRKILPISITTCYLRVAYTKIFGVFGIQGIVFRVLKKKVLLSKNIYEQNHSWCLGFGGKS